MRSPSHSDAALLDDIVEACVMILSYTKNVSFPAFAANRLVQDGVIRRLSIIGEATKNLSDDAKRRHPNIAWREMSRLRDLIAHRYWNLDVLQVWGIVCDDIPLLLAELEKGR